MTGIVLAGGQSRRMGRDKAQLAWGEGTLLTAMVDKLGLLCHEIVIVGPCRELAREVRWTQDLYVGKGPLAGLQAGLKATTSDSALVLACDTPTVPLAVLDQLVHIAQAQTVDLVIPVHSGGYEPLCAWYSREVCLPVVESLLAGGYTSLLDILPRVRVGEFQVEQAFSAEEVKEFFMNLNSRQDYEAGLHLSINLVK